MKKWILMLHVWIVLTVSNVAGQIVNNLSSDKTNIYFHAADSVIKLFTGNKTCETISVIADRSIAQNFPDSIAGIRLIKLSRDNKTPKIKRNECRLVIIHVQIIRDQFKIPMMLRGAEGLIGDGTYTCRYQYVPATMTFELREIKRGWQN